MTTATRTGLIGLFRRPIMRGIMLSEVEHTINARRRVYLLRHGDVSYFDAEGLPCRPDEVRLSDAGKAQAQAAAEALANVEIDRIVVSGTKS